MVMLRALVVGRQDARKLVAQLKAKRFFKRFPE
jgi:hypothetical protein